HQVLAAASRLGLVNRAGVKFSIDTDLFAGHRVEGEARGNFRHATGTTSDDDELDNDQDQEDYEADDQVAADDKISKGSHDHAGTALEQNQPRGGYVERKAEQGHEQ